MTHFIIIWCALQQNMFHRIISMILAVYSFDIILKISYKQSLPIGDTPGVTTGDTPGVTRVETNTFHPPYDVVNCR